MFDKRIKEDFAGSFDNYVKFLVKMIGVEWRGDVPEWLSCPSSPDLLKMQQEDIWIGDQDINKHVCPEKW